MTGVHADSFTEAWLHKIKTVKLAYKLRSKQGKKQAGHARGGPIYVKDARATMQDQEIAKDNRYLVRMWEDEEREMQHTHMHLEQVFDALTTEGETPQTNNIIQWYMKLQPNRIVHDFKDVNINIE